MIADGPPVREALGGALRIVESVARLRIDADHDARRVADPGYQVLHMAGGVMSSSAPSNIKTGVNARQGTIPTHTG